jgi:hypothetical protein
MLPERIFVVEVGDHHEHGNGFEAFEEPDAEEVADANQDGQDQNVQVEKWHLFYFVLFGNSLSQLLFVDHDFEFLYNLI